MRPTNMHNKVYIDTHNSQFCHVKIFVNFSYKQCMLIIVSHRSNWYFVANSDLQYSKAVRHIYNLKLVSKFLKCPYSWPFSTIANPYLNKPITAILWNIKYKTNRFENITVVCFSWVTHIIYNVDIYVLS